MKARRIWYFSLKNYGYFYGVVIKIYILLYVDSLSFLIIIFFFFNFIINIAGAVYNFWKIIILVGNQNKCRNVFLGIIYGVQHCGN
mmetsp:Transcript_911/g.790  ORF Transcript_911/g.790 Transcript_911/m.790 type:complete len:86 (+) Transcript_911:465-722(+)